MKMELLGSRRESSHWGDGEGKAIFSLFEPVHWSLKQSITVLHCKILLCCICGYWLSRFIYLNFFESFLSLEPFKVYVEFLKYMAVLSCLRFYIYNPQCLFFVFPDYSSLPGSASNAKLEKRNMRYKWNRSFFQTYFSRFFFW